MELQVLLHRVDVVEDIIDDAGDDALHVGVVDDALHGVRLAAGGLPVREDGSVIPAQYIYTINQ